VGPPRAPWVGAAYYVLEQAGSGNLCHAPRSCRRRRELTVDFWPPGVVASVASARSWPGPGPCRSGRLLRCCLHQLGFVWWLSGVWACGVLQLIHARVVSDGERRTCLGVHVGSWEIGDRGRWVVARVGANQLVRALRWSHPAVLPQVLPAIAHLSTTRTSALLCTRLHSPTDAHSQRCCSQGSERACGPRRVGDTLPTRDRSLPRPSHSLLRRHDHLQHA
jgi:hypothetical protein